MKQKKPPGFKRLEACTTFKVIDAINIVSTLTQITLNRYVNNAGLTNYSEAEALSFELQSNYY